MDEILSMLAAGGDMATLAFIYLIWKIDRRILLIETTLGHSLRYIEKRHIDLQGE